MTPLKNNKFPQNLMCFGEKFWKNDFQSFPNVFAIFSLTLTKTGWLYKVLANYKKKKKSIKMENLGSVAPVKQGFLYSWPKWESRKLRSK